MKAAIVKRSTIAKYGRLDPAFYLGEVDTTKGEEDIAKAEQRLKQAQARLKKAKRDAKARNARVAKLIASGEVVPITTE